MKRMIVLSCFLLFYLNPGSLLAQATEIEKQTVADDNIGGVKSMEERVRHLEETIGREVAGDTWHDRIRLSGLVEVEESHVTSDFEDPAVGDETSSDMDVATVELVVDAGIVDHLDGHVMIRYEEGDIFLDEGFIMLSGTPNFPAYLIAGRQYIPFGYFDSHFVTDPVTLLLGETNDGAVLAGYRLGGEMTDVSVGAFNGRAQKAGEDDAIDSFFASLVVNPMEGLMFGLSYTSNLAGSDNFNDAVMDPDNLDALVGGWSAFADIELIERIEIFCEYVGAVEAFKAGELYDAADPHRRRPAAWNAEISIAITDRLAAAARYGGSHDGGSDFLPETEVGAVVNWGFLENTNLAIEYLHGEFENDSETDAFVVQLAVEF